MILEEEQKLIVKLRQGSIKAFNQIYRLNAGRLLAYCMQYTKCREDAEEIVQDVFVALWNHRETIRREDSLRSLLFVMSKNRVINSYRSIINSPIYEDYVEFQDKLLADEDFHPMEYEEYIRFVKNAMQKLPVTQQRVISLSRFSLLSNKEIARTLSLSEQTVKNQLSIGLSSLRKMLKENSVLLMIILILKIVNRWF